MVNVMAHARQTLTNSISFTSPTKKPLTTKSLVVNQENVIVAHVLASLASNHQHHNHDDSHAAIVNSTLASEPTLSTTMTTNTTITPAFCPQADSTISRPNRSRSGSPNPSASPSSPQNSVKNDRGSPGFVGKRHLPVHHKPARGRGRKQQLESMTFEQLAEEAEERNAKLRQAAKDTRLRRRTREKQLKEHSDSLEKKLKDSHRQVARLQTRKPAKNPKDDCLTPSSTTTSPIFAVPSLEQHRLSKRRHSEPSLFAAPTKKKIQKNTSYPPTMTSSSSTTRGSRTDLAHKRRQDNPTNIQYKQVAVQFANRIKQQEATIVAQKTELQALRNAASLLSTDSNQLDIALTLLQGNNLEKVSKPSIREMIACNIQAQNKLFAAYFSQSSLVVEPDFDNQALGFLQSQKSFLNFIDSHP